MPLRYFILFLFLLWPLGCSHHQDDGNSRASTASHHLRAMASASESISNQEHGPIKIEKLKGTKPPLFLFISRLHNKSYPSLKRHLQQKFQIYEVGLSNQVKDLMKEGQKLFDQLSTLKQKVLVFTDNQSSPVAFELIIQNREKVMALFTLHKDDINPLGQWWPYNFSFWKYHGVPIPINENENEMLAIYGRWQSFNQEHKVPTLSGWVLPGQKLNQAALRFKKDVPHAKILLFEESEQLTPSFISFMESFITEIKN